MDAVQWGDAPTWVAAVAAVAAGAVAGLAWRAQRRLLTQQLAVNDAQMVELQDAAAERFRAQAKKVRMDRIGTAYSGDDVWVTVNVRNLSSEALYAMQVVSPDGASRAHSVCRLDDEGDETQPRRPPVVMMAPGVRVRFEIVFPKAQGEGVFLRFDDADGNSWQLSDDYRLSPSLPLGGTPDAPGGRC